VAPVTRWSRGSRLPAGPRSPRALGAVLGVTIAAIGLAACGGSPSATTRPSTTGSSSTPTTTASTAPGREVSAAAPCGAGTAPHYRHVVWIWLENEDFGSVVGAPQAPYENRLAQECGLATNYDAVSHPSLPNYLAATGGSTFGITDDGDPSVHQLTGASIFSQVEAAGLTWGAYAESMPSVCALTGTDLYAPRHNPAVYYVGIRPSCAVHDVALGTATSGPWASAIAAGTLPSFSFVTPNLCDDGHDCSVATADQWLAQFLGAVFSSPAYQAQDTVVFVTYDEGTGPVNQVATIVVGPSVVPGTMSATAFSHYSLLRTTEELLGLTPLGEAQQATSMIAAFGLR
jgi:phosphatidylinositol-3-phosphatase